MTAQFYDHLSEALENLNHQGLYKTERPIISPQGNRVRIAANRLRPGGVVNLCANNYLGLADHPKIIAAAKKGLDQYGYGMASVRFICGTQDIHQQLEKRLANFLGKDDAILFAACFDANSGLFEPLLGPDDAIVSDSLNHASIIDGIRLCKAKRYRYQSADMTDLEQQLQTVRTNGARTIMIATDGVFSMDGYLAKLPEITRLARRYDALVMVDDCHATGFMGPRGAGTPSHFDVNVDILTGTLGKALGGAIGGYIAGPQAVVDTLRQKARPYLFSNSLPPMVVTAALTALDIVETGDALRSQLFENARYWRDGLTQLGFDLRPGEHPIVPVMLGEAKLAQQMAAHLFELGVYVSGFFYPVVPKGQARIRTQMSAGLNQGDLDFALNAFEKAGKQAGVLS